MPSIDEFLFGRKSFGSGQYYCYDNQYRATYHGQEQRYISPTTGRCRPLVVQAVRPNQRNIGWKEIDVERSTPSGRKLSVWLVLHPPSTLSELLVWLTRWTLFVLALLWPLNIPKHTGIYPPYLSRYKGQLWAARSPFEHSLRKARRGEEPVREITHATYPRRLTIYDSKSSSWKICSDKNTIKRQKYVAISFPYEENILRGVDERDVPNKRKAFVKQVEAVMEKLKVTAYWMDLELVEKNSVEVISRDLYCMADVYRGAQFTLIMLCPPDDTTEEVAWLRYGERLWTFPEALLSRELRFKFGDGEVTPITLNELGNRAYYDRFAGESDHEGHDRFAEESAIINAYSLRDPLERLERLSLLKSALWRRTSRNLQELVANPNVHVPHFRADRVYALMGFFEHRIHPHYMETELQALARLSMANDNDRIVERMVSLLSPPIRDTPGWYTDKDEWGANLWDIEPEIQVVGIRENHSLVLGGCRAAAIRWKDFPSVAFATKRSYKRIIATFLPNLFWEFLLVGILLEAGSANSIPGAWVPIVVSIILLLFSPILVAYGASGRIVQAQPWLVGVKGLISAEEASTYMYGGSINAVPRTSYTPSGTPLSRTEMGQFRRGDESQLDVLRAEAESPGNNLYTLIDTLSATIYYFRAERPPTVCLYTGRESGMGRFVLCSEKCTDDELRKETVVRMPWYISQSMRVCDWVALS